MHHLYEAVNNNKNQVVVVAFPVGKNWQIYSKIYQQVFLQVGRNQERLLVPIRVMADSFGSQTDVTALYIALNVAAKGQLIVLPCTLLPCFINFKIADQQVVIVIADQLEANNSFQNIRKVLIVQYLLTIFLAQGQPVNPNFLIFRVFFLQFEQPQSHKACAGSIRLFVGQLVLK